MPHLAIIADDLTGANDTGVQFAKYGLRTHVVISAAGSSILPDDADVIVMNTDSRGLNPQSAYDRVAQAACLLRSSSIPVIYKKIDSTLRGNLGAEIDAVLDVFDFDCAVVAPAFPRIGRITVGGYHLLNQIPLQMTEIAQDPKSPVTDSRLVALLTSQSRYAVGHIPLTEVLAGGAAIQQDLHACVRRGERLIAFDATSEEHLDTIARTVQQSDLRVLWVGSAGLAEFLPAIYQLPSDRCGHRQESGGLPVLVVAGSISSVTAAQIAVFLTLPETALVTVDGTGIVNDAAAEVARCVECAREHLMRRYHVAIVSSTGRESVEAACAVGEQRGLGPAAVSDFIADNLGKITRELVDTGVEGVFMTGGDTAVRVCTALGAGCMEVCSEVAPGIPFGRLSSGPYAGLKVVTKAGAFGDKEAINNAVAIIQNK